MWEAVKVNGNDIKIARQKVVGGWVVRTFKSDQYGLTEEQDFVCDPTHKWKVFKESFEQK